MSGERVKIKDTNTVFDGMSGVIEYQDDDFATILVDFKEGKKVRQDFALNEFEMLTEGKNKGKDKRNDRVVDNSPKYDISSLKTFKNALPDEFDVMELDNSCFKLYVSDYFINSLENLGKTLFSNPKVKKVFVKDMRDAFVHKLKEHGAFIGIDVENIKFTDYNLKELKVSFAGGKPIRILYFTLPGRIMVLTDIIYHRDSNLGKGDVQNAINICKKVLTK